VLAASAARRDQGWQELAAELMPGTIGAELQELEETT
jgi:site-specific DNA recombinase